MFALVKRHKVLTGIALLVSLAPLYYLWVLAASVRGNIAAHIDVARGHYIIQEYGLIVRRPDPNVLSLAELREKYGIEVWGHGCIVTPGEPEYIDAYNAVSVPAIKRKFGEFFFYRTPPNSLKQTASQGSH